MIDEPFLQDFRRAATLGAGRPIILLIGTLVLLIVLMVAAFSYVAVRSGQEKEYINLASRQRVAALQMVALSTESLRAKPQAYITLKVRRDQFDATLKALREGDAAQSLPASPDSVAAELAAITTQWNDFRENVDTVLRAESVVRLMTDLLRMLNSSVPQLQNITADANTAGVAQTEVFTGRQAILAQRIAGHINQIMQTGMQSGGLGELFLRDLSEFENSLSRQLGVTGGNLTARTKIQEIHHRFSDIHGQVDRIREKLPDLIKAQRAGNNLLVNVDPLVDEISQLVDNYDALEKKSHAFAWLGYGLGVLGLLVLVALGHHLVSEARARAQVSAAQHKVERDAVIRLRHEIRTLGEGDLTVRATIDKKESTAAIAEAVNYMVSALRELVTAINDAAGEVASAAAETRATALHLTRGSQRQVEQISSVTAAVHNFAVAMEQVASGAQASLDVAQQSVEIADHGANAVRQVIHAMVTTREHIQDTAKRIKRLGESSQEIGNIVELINDIADQTHILALNAAIQTHSGVRNASIGTVADEVQQLAERTGYATRQIEVLVKVIQQDTQEAVMSMARSTHDVVEGTELAEGAGTALIAIQDVSVDLAGHIQNISHTAQQLARDAMEVASSMNVIKDVTNENLVGTKQAAELTENLALLSHTLRQMVSGFKLPNISVDS